MASTWFTTDEALQLSALDIKPAPIYKLRGAIGDLMGLLHTATAEQTERIWGQIDAIQFELNDREFVAEIEADC